ncbi:hypothetical protein [Clostridium thermosuccinogenes]|uniref:hypothetical protein n=1 Tax=Clostridium thermosuccinogenes TaxID=84032 RepID=UPI000CCC9985|nr:hypothetical protein [Pseudoclostridium thermosuccinogenes]PNT91264.1 hypothetical protein CDQ83_15795 [Pseudoclostridium thermosuccinogenes]
MDKNTYKVLKYLDKHSGRVLYSGLKSKFGHLKNPSLAEIEHWLFVNRFAHLDDYTETNEYGDLLNPQAIVLTIKGKQEFEKYSSQNNADRFARITAIIALLISLASLIVAYFKQ